MIRCHRTLVSLSCAAVILTLLSIFVYAYWLRANDRTGGRNATLEQIDPQHPCGAVCVVVVGELLASPIELRRVKDLVHMDGLGRVSMEELQNGLRCQGFSAAGVRLSPDSFKDLAGIPLILFVNHSHFLVALPTGVGTVVVFDPPHPVECLPASAIDDRWGGEALIVQKSPEDLQRVLTSLGISDAHVSDSP